MRFKTSLVLLLLVLALGGYAWFFEIKKPPGPEAERKAFVLKREDVQALALTQPGAVMRFEREERGWNMTAPLPVRANVLLLNDLLGDVEGLEIGGRIAGASPGPGYGLQPPQMSLIMTRHSGATDGILIGAESPDGQTVYAQRAGKTEVLLIPKAFCVRLKKGVNEFRDKVVIPMPKDRVVRMTLAYPDRRLTVARQGAGWRVEEPVPALAGTEETAAAMNTFYQVIADTYVTDDAKDFAPYGLDRPRLEVRLWDRAVGGEPSGIAIGSKSAEQRPFDTMESYYARPLGTATVVTVRLPRVDDYVKEIRHFRPRRLLDGAWEAFVRAAVEGPGGGYTAERGSLDIWRAVAPYPGALDGGRWTELVASKMRVLDVTSMEPLDPKRLKALGFEKPLGRITLTRQDGVAQVLTVGSVEEKTKEAWVTASGEDLIFTTPATVVEVLSLRYADLRSTNLLSTSLPSLQTLELVRPDGDLVFESQGKGFWTQTKPERREGGMPGLGALAQQLVSLSAEQWVAFGPQIRWADYGLDPPAATIRITCSEGNQASRTHVLALGRKDPRGAVYGRYDHAEEVAIVSPKLLELALGDPDKAPLQ